MAPPTNAPTSAFDGEIIYENVGVLQDDYRKLLHHMSINGETVVPLWVFRSFCESYARFLPKGSDEKPSSAQISQWMESLEDGEVQENGSIIHGALAVGETKGKVSRDSGIQENSDPDKAHAYDNFDYKKSKQDGNIQVNDLIKHEARAIGDARKAISQYSGMQEDSENTNAHTGNEDSNRSETYMADVYEVIMSSVRVSTMDLSSRDAMLLVAQTLLNSNRMAQPSSQTADHILYVRWRNPKQQTKKMSGVCIGFARLELAQMAISGGLQWAGIFHNCSPWATGYKQVHCAHCFRFGHSHPACKNNQLCPKCGLQHPRKECKYTGRTTCVNCGGPHKTGSSKCPSRIHDIIKEGFWPLKVKVLNAGGQREIIQPQPQHLSEAPRDIAKATEHGPEPCPEPSDPNTILILEHLDRLKALVLANNPTAKIAKRKASASDSGEPPLQRVKREE